MDHGELVGFRSATARPWLAACLTLLACDRPQVRPGDARGSEPTVHTVASSADAAAAETPTAAAGGSGDGGDGWSLLWEPVRGPRLEDAAGLDLARVVAVGGGTLYRAAEGRWQPVELGAARALEVAAAEGLLWARTRDASVDGPHRQTLRSEDGRTFEPAEPAGAWPDGEPTAPSPPACRTPPEWFDPVLVGSAADGRVVALGPGGAAAVCPVARRELVERRLANGVGGWFEQSKPAGWVPVHGDRLPREPLAVLATEPPLVVGREGQLASIRCSPHGCGAAALVDEPYPQVLELLPLADGALLLLLADRLVRLEDERGATVDLDTEGRQWLTEAARPGAWGPHHVHAAAVGGGVAVLVTTGQARGLRVDGLTGRGFLLDAEPLGAARAGAGEVVLLLNGGRVLRGTPEDWRELGHLGTIPPEGVSHAFGVFAGADGAVRLLDPRRPLVCATATALEPCGDVVAVDERAVFQLPDGLVVETQHITTTLASAGGIHDHPALPAWGIRDYAGSVASLWALTESRANGDHRARPVFRVRRRVGEEWVDVAGVPAACVPQALAVDGTAASLACEGGAVMRRDVGPP